MSPLVYLKNENSSTPAPTSVQFFHTSSSCGVPCSLRLPPGDEKTRRPDPELPPKIGDERQCGPYQDAAGAKEHPEGKKLGRPLRIEGNIVSRFYKFHFLKK